MTFYKNFKFDIVIPTYNRVKLIEKTINSVKNQNYSNWNLYILNNGSTDNTEDFIKTLLSEKIHYVCNDTNIGMVRNWLKGITEIGQEKYVVLLSDDDELCLDFLFSANESINRFPHLGMYSSAVYVKNNNKTTSWMSEYIDTDNKDYEVCLPAQNLHYFLGGNPVSPAAMVLNRESLNSITDQYLSNCSTWGFDRYWWAQLALKNTIVFWCHPTAIYHQHTQSESTNLSKNNSGQIVEGLRVTAKIINTAYNLQLITIETLTAEIKKLKAQAQLDTLTSLILFGRKELYEAALIYYKNNFELLFPKGTTFIKKTLYKLFGLKITAFIRMYKSRT